MPITIDTLILGLFVIAILFLVGGFVKSGGTGRREEESSTRRGSRIRARAGAHIRDMNAPSQAIFAGPGFSPGPLGEEPQSYAPPTEDQRLPMNWEDVDPDIRRSLERKVAALPTLPTMTTNLVAMLQDPETEPKEIAKVAATDPAIATEIIRAINSAYFALREPCNDLDRAILLLGYNWVKFLVIRMSMTKSGKNDPAYEARLSGVWRHSFMTSECVTSIIRNYTRLQQGAEASTAALLHDLGRLVELEVPGSERGVNSQVMLDSAGIPVEERVYVEQDLFGVNHCLVGGLVAEHLSLTHLVRAVQLYHHHPVNAIWNLPMNSDVIQIIAAVKLADIIVHAFEEQKNPQPKIMTGLMNREPDVAAFRPFFPNLPDFPILMGFLEPEIQKSVSFLNTFLPATTPAQPVQPQPNVPQAGVQVRYSEHPPQEGLSQVGDLVYSTQQHQGGPMGWVCVEAGNPGAWRAFGGAPVEGAETTENNTAAQVEQHPSDQSIAPDPETETETANRSNEQNPPLRLVTDETNEEAPVQGTAVQEEQSHTPAPPEPSESMESPVTAESYRDLFEDYLKAKASLGEDVTKLNYGAFAKSIERQAQKQRESSGSKVEFRVITRDGRVLIVGRRVPTS